MIFLELLYKERISAHTKTADHEMKNIQVRRTDLKE